MAKKEILTEAEELQALRAKVEQLELDKQNQAEVGDRYLREMQQIRNTKNQGINNVTIKPMPDSSLKLWHISGHNVGKMVGPIHSELAERTMLDFAAVGIKLSINRPTQEFIDAYKKTSEYKASADKEENRRALKNKSRKDSEVEKLAKAIGVLTGVEEKNRIKAQHEVGVR